MGAFNGCILIYLAILLHGCDTREAAKIQADAIRDAARSCAQASKP